MHGGASAPWCCAFIHRIAFEEVSGHWVLIKSGQCNQGLSGCGPTQRIRLEFPLESGLILRCNGKVGNHSQTKQGIRLSFPDQEGRRGSDEVVSGTSVFTSSETVMSGNFWGRMKGAKYRLVLQDGRGTSLETL